MEENKNFIPNSFWNNLFKLPTEKSDIQNILKTIPAFRKFDKKHLKLFLTTLHHREYQANEYVFHQGDPGIGLYIIMEGEILISSKTEHGYEHRFAILKEGDFFGELALLDNEVRSASAVALKNSKLYVVFRPDLDEFIDKYPKQGVEILRGISQIITTRLRRLNEDYVALYNRTLKNMQEIEDAND
ncbi:MAG: cyclic nucleotide-binding domain-containing protein [Ignavibacteria bacterium]|jgi:CRP-like cAMP-binding protein